jgi:hypothetical protein
MVGGEVGIDGVGDGRRTREVEEGNELKRQRRAMNSIA